MFLGKEIEVLPLQDKLCSQTVTKYRPFLLPRAPDTPASSSIALHLLKACRKLIKLGCTHHARFLIFKNFIQCIWFIFTPQFPPGTPHFYVPQVHVLLKTYNPMTPPCADHILLGGGTIHWGAVDLPGGTNLMKTLPPPSEATSCPPLLS